MAQSDRQFTGSIPAMYDTYLGPLIFRGYAADLAARIAALSPRRVLETAAGTGIVTRAMARILPASAEIIATDLNQPMLDYAAAQPGGGRAIWRQADAQALPFGDASFDTVVCQFGAMFFPDKTAGYREAHRVLRSGGRFLFSVWDRIEDNEFAAVVTDALAALLPAGPPRFLARTPHGHHEVAPIRDALRAAGFDPVDVETLALRSTAASAHDVAIAYCQGTPLRGEIEAAAPDRLDEATDAAAAALAARFGTGAVDGPIDGKIQAHVFTAHR
jgi:ubiquinone/menaquinone biosynthesis C-methylase UbiE